MGQSLPVELEQRLDGIRPRLYDAATEDWPSESLSSVLPDLVEKRRRQESGGEHRHSVAKPMGRRSRLVMQSTSRMERSLSQSHAKPMQEPWGVDGKVPTGPMVSLTISELVSYAEARGGVDVVHSLQLLQGAIKVLW
jgi:hypothetical protein